MRPGIRDSAAFDPRRPPERELEPNVPDGFTLGAVGDCVITRPLSQYELDPRFAETLHLLRRCDALVGNLETVILDLRRFAGHPFGDEGEWPLTALPSVADDLAQMGFNLLARANNHALDWGIEGMRESSRRLEESGLVHAGCGESRGDARAARYFESPRGRVALVSFTTTYRATTDALPAASVLPPRPGVSGLRLEATTVVPPSVHAEIERVQAALGREGLGGVRGGAPALGRRYEAGEAAGHRHAMDEEDLAEILRAIRQGKQCSDLLVAAVHSHESARDAFPEHPGEFLRELARRAIDAGADVVVTTGIHHLGPVEVVDGRPVLHGLGNFFWSDIGDGLGPDVYQRSRREMERAFEHPDRATDIDVALLLNHPYFSNAETFESVIALSRFEGGRLAELRLHPVELGYGEPLTASGIPRVARPDRADTILGRLRELSGPYGTEIAIEPSGDSRVGVIRG